MALSVGSRLGHYDVTALIGEGGMGQVYRATDTKLNRQESTMNRPSLPDKKKADPGVLRSAIRCFLVSPRSHGLRRSASRGTIFDGLLRCLIDLCGIE